jgi:molecular chaperone DnaJ
MAVRDLYEILGVDRNASEDDIRKAYRRLARELHPDVSPDPATEERFKEVTAAYEILRDPSKRRQYDRYGDGGSVGSPFADVADLFDAFFGGGGFGMGGGFGTGRTVRVSRVQRGEDVFAQTELAFEEAAFGAERELDLARLVSCDRCGGSGAEPGTSPVTCRTCGGTGRVQDVRRSVFGTVMTARPCTVCEGSGEEIVERCAECRGEGRRSVSGTLTISIPAGVSDGLELRVPGEGHAGRSGGPAGDLYLTLRVRPHAVFDRRGQDLFAVLDVSVPQAALGAELEVPTLGAVETVRLEPGTASGTTIRIRDQGLPNLGRRGRGDLFLTVHVETPRDLEREERALLERLADLRGESVGKRSGSAPARLRRPGG